MKTQFKVSSVWSNRIEVEPTGNSEDEIRGCRSVLPADLHDYLFGQVRS